MKFSCVAVASAAVLLFGACSSGSDRAAGNDSKDSLQNVGDSRPEGDKTIRLKLVSEDADNLVSTYSLSNGVSMVSRTGFAPLNEKCVFSDRNGRIVASLGDASEVCAFNGSRVVLDGDGNLTSIIVFSPEVETPEGAVEYAMDDSSLTSIAYFGGADPEDVARLFKSFNVDGNRIYDNDGFSYSLPEGEHFEYSFAEDSRFWESDLDGGIVILVLKAVDSDGVENPADSRWLVEGTFYAPDANGEVTDGNGRTLKLND